MTLWSGRFAGAPDKDVFEHGKSLRVDRRLIDDDITGSEAWAEALGRAGVLSAKDTQSILSGLKAVRAAVGLVSSAIKDPEHAAVQRQLLADWLEAQVRNPLQVPLADGRERRATNVTAGGSQG